MQRDLPASVLVLCALSQLILACTGQYLRGSTSSLTAAGTNGQIDAAAAALGSSGPSAFGMETRTGSYAYGPPLSYGYEFGGYRQPLSYNSGSWPGPGVGAGFGYGAGNVPALNSAVGVGPPFSYGGLMAPEFNYGSRIGPGFDYGSGGRAGLGYGSEMNMADVPVMGINGGYRYQPRMDYFAPLGIGEGEPGGLPVDGTVGYPAGIAHVEPVQMPSLPGPVIPPAIQQATLNANENTNTNTNININNNMGRHRPRRFGRGSFGYP